MEILKYFKIVEFKIEKSEFKICKIVELKYGDSS